MIDGSEKCKYQLIFEHQSSRVYEKRSNQIWQLQYVTKNVLKN